MIYKMVLASRIEVRDRTDDRSYMVSGEKAKTLGFKPEKYVFDAAKDIYVRFKEGYWMDDIVTNQGYFNVRKS